MSERALTCPQCNGPLAVSLFSQRTICPFCGSTIVLDGKRLVRARRFREAWAAWNAPEPYGASRWLTMGEDHWALGRLLARGEVADVHPVERARRPTHRALAKILRTDRDAARFDREWRVLETLAHSSVAGAAFLAQRLPRPVDRGTVSGGVHTGSEVMILGWPHGFHHTFEDVRRLHPAGIEPRAAIWVWRRILEALAFVHRAGFVHGALLPTHLLVEEGEHGVRLLGFGTAGEAGSRLAAVAPGAESFYPRPVLSTRTLTPAVDVAMSARAVAHLLGADPAGPSLPAAVPERLAELVATHAGWRDRALPTGDAWQLREELGQLAGEIFGAPKFCPIPLRSSAS